VTPGAFTEESAFDVSVPEGTLYGTSWNTVGPKAEWRAARGARRAARGARRTARGGVPHALILRHTFETNPEGPSKSQHYLAVVNVSITTN